MTIEELKIEANKLGYHLVKNNPTIKLLPCPMCGTKRTIEWMHTDAAGGYTRECYMCGFRAERGKTKTEARENWNKKVEESKNATECL